MSWIRLPHHCHYVVTRPPQPPFLRFFKPWVTSLLQSHLATRPTSVGHWASGPCIYTCGLLNSTHFFEVIGGDLLWMISWFYISAQSLEIVGTLGLILVAGTEGQKISLPQAILKAKQCSRAGEPLRAGIQSHKIREHRLSFKHDYI